MLAIRLTPDLEDQVRLCIEAERSMLYTIPLECDPWCENFGKDVRTASFGMSDNHSFKYLLLTLRHFNSQPHAVNKGYGCIGGLV